MRIDSNNQGTWTVRSQTRDEEEFFNFLFDALDARWGGHHLRINVPGVSQDEILAKFDISETHIQKK